MSYTKVIVESLIDSLLASDCQFWACEGYDVEPKDMVTCQRCWALHDAFKQHPELDPENRPVATGTPKTYRLPPTGSRLHVEGQNE